MLPMGASNSEATAIVHLAHEAEEVTILRIFVRTLGPDATEGVLLCDVYSD